MTREFTPAEQEAISQTVGDFGNCEGLQVSCTFNAFGAWFTISNGRRTCASGLYPAEVDRAPDFATARVLTALKLAQMWRA